MVGKLWIRAEGTPRRAAVTGTANLTLGHVVRGTMLAASAASMADVAVYSAARVLWRVPAGFGALSPVSIIVAAAVGAALAAVGLVALVRLTRSAIPIFIVSAVTVTLLSLAGPFQALAGAIPGQPRATPATGTTMIVLHILTGGIIAAVLLKQIRR